MFNHSGKSIQGVAVAFFIVSLLAGLLVAILLPYSMYIQSYGYISQGTLIFVGFMLFAIITFFSWISALLIFAFGKITETQETFLDALKKGVFSGQSASNASPGTAQQKTNTARAAASTIKWQDRVEGNKIICRHCLSKNDLNATFCRKCGKTLRDE